MLLEEHLGCKANAVELRLNIRRRYFEPTDAAYCVLGDLSAWFAICRLQHPWRVPKKYA